jgi:hypothetical protein
LVPNAKATGTNATGESYIYIQSIDPVATTVLRWLNGLMLFRHVPAATAGGDEYHEVALHQAMPESLAAEEARREQQQGHRLRPLVHCNSRHGGSRNRKADSSTRLDMGSSN